MSFINIRVELIEGEKVRIVFLNIQNEYILNASLLKKLNADRHGWQLNRIIFDFIFLVIFVNWLHDDLRKVNSDRIFLFIKLNLEALALCVKHHHGKSGSWFTLD